MKGKNITIIVSGGLVTEILDIPEGITVTVLDFDTDGVEDELLTSGESGERYLESVYVGDAPAKGVLSGKPVSFEDLEILSAVRENLTRIMREYRSVYHDSDIEKEFLSELNECLPRRYQAWVTYDSLGGFAVEYCERPV